MTEATVAEKLADLPKSRRAKAGSTGGFSDDDVRAIRRRHHEGVSSSAIARALGVSQGLIQNIVTGRYYADVPPEEDVPLHVTSSGSGRKGRFSDSTIREIRALRKNGKTFREIGEQFEISTGMVGWICSGVAYAHVTDEPGAE